MHRHGQGLGGLQFDKAATGNNDISSVKSKPAAFSIDSPVLHDQTFV
jgi:hypothetical protein